MTDRKIVSLSLPPDVAERLDNFANKNHVNRSQMVAMMISAYMDAEEAKPQVLQMAEGMGALMKNLFEMTPDEIRERLAGVETQMQALPDSIKEQAPTRK